MATGGQDPNQPPWWRPLNESTSDQEEEQRFPVVLPDLGDYDPNELFDNFQEQVELAVENRLRTESHYSFGPPQNRTLFCYSDRSTPLYYRTIARGFSRPIRRYIWNPHLTDADIAELACLDINHRTTIHDFYIPADLEWDCIVPIDINFVLNGVRWQVRDMYLFNIINNSTYIRERLRIAILDGQYELTLKFDTDVLPDYWMWSVLSQQVTWAEVMHLYPNLDLASFLQFAHCFGFSELYILYVLDIRVLTDKHMVQNGIYVANHLLNWEDVALLLTKKAYQIHNYAFLLKIKADSKSDSDKKLRSALRSYEHTMDRIDRMTTILHFPSDPPYLTESGIPPPDYDPNLIIGPEEDKIRFMHSRPSAEQNSQGGTANVKKPARLDLQSWLQLHGIPLRCHNPRYIAADRVVSTHVDVATQSDTPQISTGIQTDLEQPINQIPGRLYPLPVDEEIHIVANRMRDLGLETPSPSRVGRSRPVAQQTPKSSPCNSEAAVSLADRQASQETTDPPPTPNNTNVVPVMGLREYKISAHMPPPPRGRARRLWEALVRIEADRAPPGNPQVTTHELKQPIEVTQKVNPTELDFIAKAASGSDQAYQAPRSTDINQGQNDVIPGDALVTTQGQPPSPNYEHQGARPKRPNPKGRGHTRPLRGSRKRKTIVKEPVSQDPDRALEQLNISEESPVFPRAIMAMPREVPPTPVIQDRARQLPLPSMVRPDRPTTTLQLEDDPFSVIPSTIRDPPVVQLPPILYAPPREVHQTIPERRFPLPDPILPPGVHMQPNSREWWELQWAQAMEREDIHARFTGYSRMRPIMAYPPYQLIEPLPSTYARVAGEPPNAYAHRCYQAGIRFPQPPPDLRGAPRPNFRPG